VSRVLLFALSSFIILCGSPLEIMPNPHTDPAVIALLLREAPRHGLRTCHVWVIFLPIHFNGRLTSL
jgi:hypothetical protein